LLLPCSTGMLFVQEPPAFTMHHTRSAFVCGPVVTGGVSVVLLWAGKLGKLQSRHDCALNTDHSGSKAPTLVVMCFRGGPRWCPPGSLCVK